jgi:NDP-sugar pyrophosphorylase family protein
MRIGSILFAAGEGKRLRPLTYEIPKPSLPLLDVPLARYGLAALLEAAPPTLVNVSYLGERVAEDLGDNDVEIFREEPEAFGTAGTLSAVRDRVHDPLLVANCDLLSDIDFGALLRAHGSNAASATLVVRAVKRAADFEVDEDLVTGFIDRRERPEAGGVQFLGAAVYDRDVLDLLPGKRPAGLGETLLAGLAESGRMAVHHHRGYALDVGTPQSYLQASIDLLNGSLKTDLSFPGEIVHVDDGVSYVGTGARYAPGSIGPNTILLRDSSVSEGAFVEDSIVWPSASVPTGREVRRSIWTNDGPIDAAPPQE